jgi:bifunctional non-homologous end joining protein LigD
MLKSACQVGLEGIVSKAGGQPIPIRPDKCCRQRETLSIVGYAMKDSKFDGPYLGRGKGSNLVYAGKVDHGFTSESAKDLRGRLTPLVKKSQAYVRRIKAKAMPSLRAEIEYRAKFAEGKLRHPYFKGLRDDL